MKKSMGILFSGMMFLSAAACGSNAGGTADGAAKQADVQAPAGKKVLVAYYSRSGNTKAVAQQIQRLTGGDLFEIQTVKEYPASYSEMTEIAKKELAEGYTPELKNKAENWAAYDVVFIGSPDWWGTYAPAVRSFIAQYNFGGKTVAPFFTNGGGGMQNCESDMKKQLAGVSVAPGITFPGRSSGAPEQELKNWIQRVLK
ncbi:flavodoxin [Candidatus Avelusimicrobium alvi]|uniref:flavodoxin n=1 Tax=Candidatus Avelusimicrobium alvi TaxID=3416221 RepID=UPI003D0A0E97